nr:MAG TPA: hypothetical protein [Bacteriophage sp.]
MILKRKNNIIYFIKNYSFSNKWLHYLNFNLLI